MTAVASRTGTSSRPAARSATESTRARIVRRRLMALAALAATAMVAYLTFDVQGSWSYALDLRGRQLGALVVVGASIGASSLVFQTVAGSRILTPGVIGFDAVFVLVQTVLVQSFGDSLLTRVGVTERFVLNTVILVVFGLVLFRALFRSHTRDLFVLMLVGIVLGTLFNSLTIFVSRLLSPDDYLTLQSLTFASFNTVNLELLLATTAACGLGLALLRPVLPSLDVIELGRDNAIALGVDYHRVVTRCLVIVTLLVASTAALVGPILFLGLIVANLARQVIPSHRHAVLTVGAGLVGVVATVVGQLLVVHVFELNTTLSVVINLVGGIYFIGLLLRSARL